MNYRDIINKLETLANNHIFIKQFGYGNLSDIAVPEDQEAPDYPYMFVNPVDVSVNNQVTSFNCNIIIMTQVLDTEDAEILGQSRCSQYMRDIVSYFTNSTNDPLYSISTPFTLTPFKERFQDDVVGVTANITIEVAEPLSFCDAPFENIDGIVSRPELGEVLVIDGDGRDYRVTEGNTFTCLPATPRSGIYYLDPNVNSSAEPEQINEVEGFTKWYHQQGYLPVPAQTQNALVYQAIAEDDSYDTAQRPFNLLKYDNVFGNKYRFTNDAGNKGSTITGYARPQFHYLNDWAGATHGIVIDHLTGLMWTAYSQSPPNGNQNSNTFSHSGVTYQYETYDYPSFVNHCHGLNGETQFNLGGYTDWRMPTLNELMTIFRPADGYQSGYPGLGPSSYFNEAHLYDWYITRGNTSNPPRNTGNTPSSTNWGTTSVQCLSGYFIRLNNVGVHQAGIYCRVWRG